MPLDVIALIPARGGSKRIPGKNVVHLRGEPLVAHTVRQAVAARVVREVYVSTDDAEIAAAARAAGAGVIWRPPSLSGDEATSESALVHALDHRRSAGAADPDLVVFLQATSPIRRTGDIDGAVETLLDAGADSLFSATVFHRFVWAEGGEGGARSINYDYRRRQREQDLPRQYQENGSIYLFRPALLRETNNRLGGKIAIFPMDYWSSFQVDSAEDVELCEWILSRPEFAAPPAWPPRIGLVVFDFDGVMTDNAVWLAEDGSEQVRCHRGDGWGLARLRETGVPMMVLSTEERTLAALRSAKLQIPCHHGVADKAVFLERYLREQAIDTSEVVYVGNDTNDLLVMRLVGFPVAVADAHPDVRAMARLVLSAPGGHGAVREFCDRLIAHLSVV